jgi:hypothetical protein
VTARRVHCNPSCRFLRRAPRLSAVGVAC